MKLRIKGDSLRLRLTQSEVASLAADGFVTDSVHFTAGSALHYRLRRDAAIDKLTAGYTDNAIEISVPDAAALKWCHSDLITLESTRQHPEGDLRITVEKDFTCLAPRAGEDESDHFPHPKASC